MAFSHVHMVSRRAFFLARVFVVSNEDSAAQSSSEDNKSRTNERVQGLMATWQQVTAHWFMQTRMGYALAVHNPAMQFNPAKPRRDIIWVALIVAVVLSIGATVYAKIHPAGQISGARVVMARESGALYVKVNGMLVPVLNLASARLIAGTAEAPTVVPIATINQEGTGPKWGISGAPWDMPVSNPSMVTVSVCQKVPTNSTSTRPVVTLINGAVQLGTGRADELGPTSAAVGVLNDQTFLIWGGRKMVIDPADRIVLPALGIDRALAATAGPLTPAVGNVIPSAQPLTAPQVPGSGDPSPWAIPAPATPIGTVVTSDLPGHGKQFFVVLREGVQQIPETVAAMLRAENSFGAGAIPVVGPDVVARAPMVTILTVGHYPEHPVKVVDSQTDPVLCWSWERGSTATTSSTQVISGRELPISPSSDRFVVKVSGSGGDPGTADQVVMGPGSANWVTSTGIGAQAATKESAWWISREGTRFGVDNDARGRESLGLSAPPEQMPWQAIRLIPRGLPEETALTRVDALVSHDSLPMDPKQKGVSK